MDKIRFGERPPLNLPLQPRNKKKARDMTGERCGDYDIIRPAMSIGGPRFWMKCRHCGEERVAFAHTIVESQKKSSYGGYRCKCPR